MIVVVNIEVAAVAVNVVLLPTQIELASGWRETEGAAVGVPIAKSPKFIKPVTVAVVFEGVAEVKEAVHAEAL